METDTITGSEHTVPAHAAVIRSECPSPSADVTMTAGTGARRFDGFQISWTAAALLSAAFLF